MTKENIRPTNFPLYQVNEMCIVMWLDDVLNIPRWYLGYVSEMDGEKYIVEHLVREKSSNDNFCKNPSNISKHFL